MYEELQNVFSAFLLNKAGVDSSIDIKSSPENLPHLPKTLPLSLPVASNA